MTVSAIVKFITKRTQYIFKVTLIDRLGKWARKWGMRFLPIKCNMMQLIRKWVKRVIEIYTLEGTILENVDRTKYLSVTITNDLRWNPHIGNICTKANRTLGFLRRNLSSCIKRLRKWHTRDWWDQSWSMQVSLGSQWKNSSGRIGKGAELSS